MQIRAELINIEKIDHEAHGCKYYIRVMRRFEKR